MDQRIFDPSQMFFSEVPAVQECDTICFAIADQMEAKLQNTDLALVLSFLSIAGLAALIIAVL